MKRFVPVLMLAVVALAGSAWGDSYGTVDMTFLGAGDGQHTSPVVNVTTPNVGGVYAGPYLYQFTNNASTNTLGLGGLGSNGISEQDGFCVDFNHDIWGGAQGTFTVEDLSTYLGDPTKASQIEELMGYATVSQMVPTGPSSSYIGTVSPTGPAVSPASTGLSLAIWAVLLASGDTVPSSVSTPTFAVTSNNTYGTGLGGTVPVGTDIAFANDLLTDLATNPNHETYISYGKIYALAQTGEDPLQGQSVVLVGTYPSFSSVPEPCACVGLVGLAFCGLPIGVVALLRRRRA